jgi:hypothetical protein
MQAQRRDNSAARLRALALLLTCVLGLTLVTAAGSGQAHRHLARGVAVVAVTGSDTLHSAFRHDQDATLQSAPAAAVGLAGRLGPSDSSTSVSSRTARTPKVRGPPEEALA